MEGERPESSRAVHSAPAKVALSTSATFPATSLAFELASRLGYDGVEVMVSVDTVSQDAAALAGLSEHYEMPVLSLHAPTLLLTQRVWGTDAWGKIDKAREVAAALGARTVVAHPPFRWQRTYAREFVAGIASRNADGGPVVSVENMFPWRAGSREMLMYAPGWDPRDADYEAVTLDLSHTAVSGSDALAMAEDLGERLSHVHLADGSGSSRDEHLVPGRGNQPCAELLDWLARRWFTGTVVVEVSTRGAADRDEQEQDLAEALAYARLNLVVPAERYAGP
jgi:sugar phosphate isomerase/epimerase